MSGVKTMFFEGEQITTREARMARYAADEAIAAVFKAVRRNSGIEQCDFREWAKGEWPLPKVQRLRVVTLRQRPNGPTKQYRVEDGVLCWNNCGWIQCSTSISQFSPEFLRAIVDLLANPFEEEVE